MDAQKQKFEEQIKSLMPISGLAPQYQNEVVQQAELLKFKKKQHVFKQGSVDPFTYYLLEGELQLEANGQLLKTIQGGSPDAKSALSQLQPRQMSAKSTGKSLVMRVPRDLMDRLLTMGDPGGSAGSVVVSEVDDEEDGGGDWMTRMLQSELFSRIPPANIQRVFTVMESVELKAGAVVVEQGSPGDYYYIIQSGRCEVSRKASGSGAPVKLAELDAGDSFGEEALVSDAKRNATVTMISDGELVRLTKEDFIELIKKPSLDSVDYDAANALVAEGACWLDVRFSEEHAKDGIDASVNIPLNQLRAEIKNLESDRIYIAYCDSGARSSAGAFLLAQNGFDGRIHLVVAEHDFDLYLGQDLKDLFGAAVSFRMAFLPTETLGFGDRDTLQANLLQRFFHFIELERFDDRFDFLHGRYFSGLALAQILAPFVRPFGHYSGDLQIHSRGC